MKQADNENKSLLSRQRSEAKWRKFDEDFRRRQLELAAVSEELQRTYLERWHNPKDHHSYTSPEAETAH